MGGPGSGKKTPLPPGHIQSELAALPDGDPALEWLCNSRNLGDRNKQEWKWILDNEGEHLKVQRRRSTRSFGNSKTHCLIATGASLPESKLLYLRPINTGYHTFEVYLWDGKLYKDTGSVKGMKEVHRVPAVEIVDDTIAMRKQAEKAEMAKKSNGAVQKGQHGEKANTGTYDEGDDYEEQFFSTNKGQVMD